MSGYSKCIRESSLSDDSEVKKVDLTGDQLTDIIIEKEFI